MGFAAPYRVHQSSTTTGTGTYSLTVANPAYRNFNYLYASGAVVPYVATDYTGNYEIGLGTLTIGSPDTLARTTILDSSASGSAVTWPSGTRDIFTYEAADAIYLVGYTGNKTADGTGWGTDYIYTGTGGSTFTLPLLSEVPAGYKVATSHCGTGALAFALSGSDVWVGEAPYTSMVNGQRVAFKAMSGQGWVAESMMLSTLPWTYASTGTSQFTNAQATLQPLATRASLRWTDAVLSRELHFSDFVDPSSTADKTTAFQNWFLFGNLVALTLKNTSLDNVLLRTSVKMYGSRGSIHVFCPIVIPEYVEYEGQASHVRMCDGSTGGVATYTGDTTTKACNLIYQPLFTVVGRAHVSKIDIYCNPDGNTAHQGSGIVFGKNWVPSAVTLQSSGTGGYAVNDVLTLANPSVSPYAGAVVTVNTVDGSGNILTYTLTTPGAYALPAVLQTQQWTSAAGFNVFDNSGNYKTTGGTGRGATFSITWTSDFVSGSYYSGISLIFDTSIGNIRCQAVGTTFSGTYGAVFGALFASLNHTINGEVQVVGGSVGTFFQSNDTRINILNPVQSAAGLQFFGGGSIECPNVVIDSPLQTAMDLDHGTGYMLRGRAFTNLSLTPSRPGTPGPITIGQHSSVVGSGHYIDMVLDAMGTYYANTVNPAVILKNICQSTFDLKVVQGNGGTNPYTSHLLNQFAQIETGVDLPSITLKGSINNASGALFIDGSGTAIGPACHVDVWDGSITGYAKTYGTYEIYNNGAPTNGTLGTGVNKAWKASQLFDISAGNMYLNQGSATSLTWVEVVTYPSSGPNIARVLGQSTLPMIFCSSGSMGNNGAITGLTALPTTYTAAYIYMEAGWISSGSAAGWYYYVASSSTAGTVYNNTYTSGTPLKPASPTAFSTTGPGTFTRTTGVDVASYQYSVAANQMGTTDRIEVTGCVTVPNNSNSKLVKLKMDSTLLSTGTVTTSVSAGMGAEFVARDATNVQVTNSNFGALRTVTSIAPTYTTFDMTTSHTLSITLQLATATDYAVWEQTKINYVPGVP